MLDKMYEINLAKEMKELKRKNFPDLLKACRELMGLKQYACADYLGLEQPRYKKLELGTFKLPLEAWELARLVEFFKLDSSMFSLKHDEFIEGFESERKKNCKKVWDKRKNS